MIGRSESIAILNGLVAQGSTTGTSGNVSNGFGCYNAELALFTKLPTTGGMAYTEVSLDGYCRRALTGYSIGGEPIFGSSAAWDGAKGKYTIANTGPIQMHAIEESENEEEEVVGFGIFAASSGIGEPRLLAWGQLLDENGDPVVKSNPEADPPIVGTAPVLTGGSVPVFYTGDFQLLFGGENGGMAATGCIGLLNTLVQEGSSSATTGVHTFTLATYSPELALFTTLPDAQGSGGVEVPEEITVGQDTVATGYTRKMLWGYAPTSGQLQFASSASIGPVGSSTKVSIKNTDEVQMSAIHTDISDEYKVLGFGIYAAETIGGAKRLLAWGPLVDANGNPVTSSNAPVLTGGSVPIFYAGNFMLIMGGDIDEVYIAVSGISIDAPSTTTLANLSSSVQLSAQVTPSNASDPTITWSTDNSDVATVNSVGLVTPGTVAGEATITALAGQGQNVFSDTITITSEAVKPTGITLDKSSASIRVYSSGIPAEAQYLVTITATVLPNSVAVEDSKVSFDTTGLTKKTSTDSSATFYGRSTGTFTVTVYPQRNPQATATCTVTVTA